MASAIFTAPYLTHTSSVSPTIARKPTSYASFSTSQFSHSRNPKICSPACVSHTCLAPFSTWNGLRKHGFSISVKSLRLEKRKKCKGKGVFASLFGVGAPEALVIGVVALLVFGPKGLAEVAKSLGKTLRAFQPTIRELQEVSREFKSTLEKEIGLDELKNPVQGNYTSNTASSSSNRIPDDTLQNSQLTETPPEDSPPTATTVATTEDSLATATTTEDSLATASTTEDSSATATTPADSPATATTPADSPATATTPADSPATATIPADSPAPVTTPVNSQETTASPVITTDDSQPTVDPTNGSPSNKAYSSEDLLKITEEQLKAIQQPSSETPKTEI